MTNLEIVNLYKFLSSKELNSVVFSIKANLAIQKNIQLLKNHVLPLSEVEKKINLNTPRFAEYIKKEKELIDRHPHTGEGVTTVFHDRAAFEAEVLPLQLEYKEEIDAFAVRKAEWIELLGKEAEISLVKISISDLPTTLEKGIFESLYPILEE